MPSSMRPNRPRQPMSPVPKSEVIYRAESAQRALSHSGKIPLMSHPDNRPKTHRNFLRDNLLTFVSVIVTSLSSLIEGHGAEAHRVMGARAVPAGGFAACSRAAWASCLPAL
jgi:hypothetical protein